MSLTLPNLNPDTRTLKQFGAVALIGFGAIGGLIMWRGGLFGADFGAATAPVAYALWALGALSAVFSLVAPTLNRFIFVPLTVLTYPIGFTVSVVLLSLLFFGLITPLGVFFRLIGRDTMDRSFDRDAQSYFHVRTEPPKPAQYFSQY